MKGVFSKSEPSLVSCESNYSFFFDFVEKELPGPNGAPFRAPLHRVCTLMRKMKVKCFLREELEHDTEILEEVAALEVRTDTKIKAEVVRFTFFRRAPTGTGTESWRELADKDILGYAVLLRPDPPLEVLRTDGSKYHVSGYILEAVISPPNVVVDGGGTESVTNYYIHCCREFETTVGIKRKSKSFKLVGTFFCQQNGYTNACAHAALRMATNSWPAYHGPKVTYEAINKLLAIDHAKLKKKRNEGLDTVQIATVINALGYEVETALFRLRPDINYEDFIYPLIESGCPVILWIARPGVEHVITVIGHTLNSDRWAEARHGYGTMPKATYISASAWADHFIFNDDNFGMYVTLPSEAVKNVIVPQYNPNLHAAMAFGIFPEKPNLPAGQARVFGYSAELQAAVFLRKLLADTQPTAMNLWFNLLKDGHTPVCRTVLQEKAGYLKALAEMVDEKGNTASDADKKLVESVLPDRFWVTEIMTPSLYAGNKRKLGEIVVNTRVDQADVPRGSVFVFAWVAGVAWHGPLLRTGPLPWRITGHVPLTRGIPVEKCKLEW
jgi:hypothetical protein